MANANWREKSHCNIIMAFYAIVTGIIEFDVEWGILVTIFLSIYNRMCLALYI